MKKLVYALRFLTILPVPWRHDEDLDDVARSAAYFPFVGLLVAASVWGFGLLVSLGFGAGVRRIAAVVAWVVVTGGLHLDGLADTADGFGGGRDPAKRLSIMKDSRIGTFGVLAILVALGLKAAIMVEMPASQLGPALVLAAVIARCAPVLLIAVFPPARPDGLGAFFAERLRSIDVALAVAVTATLCFAAGGVVGVLIAGACLGLSLFVGAGLSRGLGGLTGDSYGAITEGLEVAVLAAAYLLPLSSILNSILMRLPQW